MTSKVNGFNIFEYLTPAPSTTVDVVTAHHDLNPTLLLLSVVRYDGEFDATGRFHGYGKLVSNMNYNYEGEFDAGMMHGKGHIDWSDGTMYEGEFVENRITGKGMYIMPSGDVYKGDVSRGQRHGLGQYTQARTGHSYDGSWHMGVKKGKGTMYFKQDMTSYYRGQWDDNVQNGHGIMVYASGSVYDGDWSVGQPHGTGAMITRLEGVIVEEYRGSWLLGKPHGAGSTMYITPHVSAAKKDGGGTMKETTINRYDGEYVHGVRHGLGTFLYQDGSKYEGSWVANAREGEGKFTHPNGTIYVGTFEKGKLLTTTDVKLTAGQTEPVAAVQQLPCHVVLFIEDLLFTVPHKEETINGVQALISRHGGVLKRIFNYYCTVDKIAVVPCLGAASATTAIQTMSQMSVMQLWRLLSDCHMFDHHLTIAVVDRILSTLRSCSNGAPPSKKNVEKEISRDASSGSLKLPKPNNVQRASRDSTRDSVSVSSQQSRRTSKSIDVVKSSSGPFHDIHSGRYLLSFRDFVEAIVRISHTKYAHVVTSDLSLMVQHCLEDIIVTHACNAAAPPMWGSLKDVASTLPTHQASLEAVFAKCQQSSFKGLDLHRVVPQGDHTITVRQFLALVKEMGVVDTTSLTLHTVLKLFEREKLPDAARVEKSLAPSVESDTVADRVWERKLATERAAFGFHSVNVTNTLSVDVEIVFAEFVEALVKIANMKLAADPSATTAAQRFDLFATRYLKTVAV